MTGPLTRDDLAASQPAPTPRPGGASMHDVAAALHLLRRDHGLVKYASLLQAMNGRDPGIDELQELLDGLVYRIQAVLEWRALHEALAEVERCLSEAAEHADDEDVRTAYRRARNVLLEECRVDRIAARADTLAAALLAEEGP